MIKNFLKILLFSAIFLYGISITNAQMLVPSLMDTMQQNEKILKENLEQKNTTTSIPQTITPQFTPALSDNFTYTNIFTGASIVIKKSNETNLFISEISLDKGAEIGSALEVVSYNENTGEPQFAKKTLNETLASLPKKPTFLINGQFFNPRTEPSELSFGLKSENIIRTAWADNRNERKNILHISGGIAEILPYSWKNLEGTAGSFAMVNLSVTTPRYKDENIGRTYICVANPDANNRSSKLLVFVAEAMSEWMIENEIYKHGCKPNSTSKLDSSGSTRFWHNNNTLYGLAHKGEADRRKIPHTLVFFDNNSNP